MGKRYGIGHTLIMLFGVLIVFSTLLTSSELNKSDIAKYFEQATKYRQNSEFEKLREVYSKIIKLDPNNYKAHKNMGSSYLDTKEYDKAIEFYKKSIEINPKKFNAYHNMGLVYFYQKNYDNALDFFEKSLTLNPKFYATYFFIGKIYSSRKKYNKAIDFFQKSIEINPRDIQPYHHLVSVYTEQKDFNKALQVCYKIIEIAPKRYNAYEIIGTIYQFQKKFDLSIEFYEKALKLDPDNQNIQANKIEVEKKRESYKEITQGKEYINRGEYSKAIESYTKAIDIHPRDAGSYYQIGRVYILMGKHNKAREFFSDSLMIKPNGNAYFAMGASYLQEQKYDESLKYFTMALEEKLTYLENNDSEIGVIYDHMGSIWGKKGEYDKALEFYTKALEISVNTVGEEDMETRNLYYNMGVTWERKGEIIKAQEFYTKAHFSNKVSPTMEIPSTEKEKKSEEKEVVTFILGMLMIGFSLLFHSKQKRVALISPSNNIKEIPFLFSWTVLLFAFIVPLMRKDYLWFFITLISYPFGGSIIISFLYNKIYIKNLIKTGYRPVDIDSENLLNSKGIKVYHKEYNEIFKKEENSNIQKMVQKLSKKESSQVNKFTTCKNCSASKIVIEDGIYICEYCGTSVGSV